MLAAFVRPDGIGPLTLGGRTYIERQLEAVSDLEVLTLITVDLPDMAPPTQ